MDHATSTQRGMRDSPLCPYCKQPPETEEHMPWQCPEWTLARYPLPVDVRTQAAELPHLRAEFAWPPCLKLCGLPPPPPLPTCPQPVKDNAITFLLALHRMYIAVLAARKLRRQKQPALFPCRRLSSGLCAYPYQQPRPVAQAGEAPYFITGHTHSEKLAVGTAFHDRFTAMATGPAVV